MLDVIKTVASALAIPLAILTFYLGYKQKERERTLTYYHKVVVDVVLPQTFSFFDKHAEGLSQAAREALGGMTSPEAAIPRSSTQALATFSTELFDLKDKIVERTAIFDEQTAEEISTAFEKIQDDAAGWFNDVSLHKRREVDGVAAILKRGRRAIVKQLYRGQFRQF